MKDELLEEVSVPEVSTVPEVNTGSTVPSNSPSASLESPHQGSPFDTPSEEQEDSPLSTPSPEPVPSSDGDCPPWDLIPGLPPDIALRCLAFVPRRRHSTARCVCRGWAHELRSPSFFSLRKELRQQEEWLVLIAGGRGGLRPLRLEAFDPSLLPPPSVPSSFCLHPSPSLFLWGASMVSLGPSLFLLGGATGTESYTTQASAWCFDGGRARWREVAPMLGPRSNFACGAVGSRFIIVAGGWGPSGKSGTGVPREPLRSAELYDSQRDTWHALVPMQHRRGSCMGVVFRGRFVAVSGIDKRRNDGGTTTTLTLRCAESLPADESLYASLVDSQREGGASTSGNDLRWDQGTSRPRHYQNRRQDTRPFDAWAGPALRSSNGESTEQDDSSQGSPPPQLGLVDPASRGEVEPTLMGIMEEDDPTPASTSGSASRHATDKVNSAALAVNGLTLCAGGGHAESCSSNGGGNCLQDQAGGTAGGGEERNEAREGVGCVPQVSQRWDDDIGNRGSREAVTAAAASESGAEGGDIGSFWAPRRESLGGGSGGLAHGSGGLGQGCGSGHGGEEGLGRGAVDSGAALEGPGLSEDGGARVRGSGSNPQQEGGEPTEQSGAEEEKGEGEEGEEEDEEEKGEEEDEEEKLEEEVPGQEGIEPNCVEEEAEVETDYLGSGGELQWHLTESMWRQISLPGSLAVVGDRLFGVADIANTLREYDPDANLWHEVCQVPYPQKGFHLVALNRGLLLLGVYGGHWLMQQERALVRSYPLGLNDPRWGLGLPTGYLRAGGASQSSSSAPVHRPHPVHWDSLGALHSEVLGWSKLTL